MTKTLKTKTLIATALIAIPLFAACEPVTRDGAKLFREDQTEVIYVSYETASFDADAGDTVIMIMPEEHAHECADFGGELDVQNRINYCVGIDF